MNTQPEFRLSSDSKALAKELEAVEVGATVSYSQLTAAIGRDVQGGGRGALETARRIVQRDHRAVFDVVRNTGLKRLADSEIVDLSDRARDGLRHSARRIAKKLVCVDYQKLTAAHQCKHNAALSMFGAIAEMATDTAQRRLEKNIQANTEQLPAAKAAIEALGIA